MKWHTKDARAITKGTAVIYWSSLTTPLGIQTYVPFQCSSSLALAPENETLP